MKFSTATAFASAVLLFALNGMVMGAYTASLPILTARFELRAMDVSWLLIVSGVFAIVSMQLGGRLADRFGAKRPALVSIVFEALGLATVALAPEYAYLLVAAAFLGFGNGGIDVTMNVVGVEVEKARPRPVMSFLHGCWALGNFCGSLALAGAALLLESYQAVRLMTAVVACCAVAMLFVTIRITPETPVREHVDADGIKSPIPRAAWLLGLMGIAFGIGEGTAWDWGGNHVREVAQVDGGLAAWAVPVMAVCMTAIRLTGDLLVVKMGRRTLVRCGAACAVAGYLVVSTLSSYPLLLVGWGLVGLGMGVIAPQVYALSGHLAGGRGLALVVTFGYAAWLAGPFLIGLEATYIGLQHAMFLPLVLLVGLLALTKILPLDEPNPSS